MTSVFSRSLLVTITLLGLAGPVMADDPAATPPVAEPSAAEGVAPAAPPAAAPTAEAAPAPASAPAPAPAPTPPPVDDFVAPTSRIPVAANHMGPVNLQWRALAALDLPGLGGFRFGADAFLPTIPLYISGQLVKSWGLGSDSGVNFDSSTLWEVRAGFSFPRWVIAKEDERFSLAGNSFQDVGVRRPRFHRKTPFVGIRQRIPANDSCNDAVPPKCSSLTVTYLTVGISTLVAEDASVVAPEMGQANMKSAITLEAQLLFGLNSVEDHAAWRRLGLDLTAKANLGWLAYSMGLGWDGEVVLFHMGLGLGHTHSFRPVVPSSEITAKE